MITKRKIKRLTKKRKIKKPSKTKRNPKKIESRLTTRSIGYLEAKRRKNPNTDLEKLKNKEVRVYFGLTTIPIEGKLTGPWNFGPSLDFYVIENFTKEALGMFRERDIKLVKDNKIIIKS